MRTPQQQHSTMRVNRVAIQQGQLAGDDFACGSRLAQAEHCIAWEAAKAGCQESAADPPVASNMVRPMTLKAGSSSGMDLSGQMFRGSGQPRAWGTVEGAREAIDRMVRERVHELASVHHAVAGTRCQNAMKLLHVQKNGYFCRRAFEPASSYCSHTASRDNFMRSKCTCSIDVRVRVPE